MKTGSEGCVRSGWKRGGSGEGDLIPVFSFLEGVTEHKVRLLRGAQQKDERQQTQVAVKEILIKHTENNSSQQTVIHRKRLPTVTSESPFLEIQNSSGLSLSNLTQLQGLPCSTWRTEADDLQRPHLA